MASEVKFHITISKNEVHKVAIRIIRTPEIEKLASRAYHCGFLCLLVHDHEYFNPGTTVPEIQAEAYFILGRSHHASGNMKVAMPYYTQACKLSPSFALAQYRLAQVVLGVIFCPVSNFDMVRLT